MGLHLKRIYPIKNITIITLFLYPLIISIHILNTLFHLIILIYILILINSINHLFMFIFSTLIIYLPYHDPQISLICSFNSYYFSLISIIPHNFSIYLPYPLSLSSITINSLSLILPLSILFYFFTF